MQENPTDRELDILKILWKHGEASVRQVYEDIRNDAPIVQNTVQAMLRTMEEKGLVSHRTEVRAFIYKPAVAREQANQTIVRKLLDSVFDGAMDQFVNSLFSLRKLDADEIKSLERLIKEQKRKQK